jgi:hypothetical protein
LHEHLSLHLDWLNGVGYAIRTGLAAPKGLRAQLEGSIIWHAWFIENLLTEIDRQTSDSRGPRLRVGSTWCDWSIRRSSARCRPSQPKRLRAESWAAVGIARDREMVPVTGSGSAWLTAIPSFCQAGTSPAKVVISVSSWAKLSGTATTV